MGRQRIHYLTVSEGATLTIPTGRTVKIDYGGQININGTLKATGVKFTWADGQNPWEGILFVGSGANNSRLENCVIEHASTVDWFPRPGIVSMFKSSPTIIGCTINNSDANGRFGIYLAESSSPVISNSIISGMTQSGIYVSGFSTPTVTGNTLRGNQTGIGITNDSSGTYQGNTFSESISYGLSYSGSTMLTATNNNWGDTSGPLDDSDDRATGGLYNPNGKGNRVSDHVNYSPWLVMTVAILPGDINNDGFVDLTDAILALQVGSAVNIAIHVYKEADVNEDQKIGLPEVLYILQKAAGAR